MCSSAVRGIGCRPAACSTESTASRSVADPVVGEAATRRESFPAALLQSEPRVFNASLGGVTPALALGSVALGSAASPTRIHICAADIAASRQNVRSSSET